MTDEALDRLLKRSVKDVAVYVPGRLLPALTGLITVPIFTRLFSPKEYGMLAIIGVLTAVGSIAFVNWLSSSVMRFEPWYRHEATLDRFYGALVLSFFVSMGFAVAIGPPVVHLMRRSISQEVFALVPLVGLSIGVSGLLAVLQTTLRAAGRARLYVVVELANGYGALIVGVVLVMFFGYGVTGIVWGGIAGTGICALFLLSMLGAEGARPSFGRETWSGVGRFARYGLPGAVATIGTWLLSLSDRYVIEAYRGGAEVGLYAIGYNGADKTVNLVVFSIMMAVGPVLINTWESDDRKYTGELLKKLTRIMLLAAVPMVAGLAVLSHSILAVLATPAYAPAAPVMGWAAAGAAIYGLSLLAYTGLILGRNTVVMARNYLVAGLANVGLNLIFVPRFGFMAAAVSTPVSYALLLGLNAMSARKYLLWQFPWRSMRNIAVAVMTMGLCLHVVSRFVSVNPITVIALVAVGAIIYGTILLALHEISDQELRAFRKVANKLKHQAISCLARES